MRARFVTSVAANAVTNNHHAIAVNGKASVSVGDPFATVLDEVVQAPGNDNAGDALDAADQAMYARKRERTAAAS